MSSVQPHLKNGIFDSQWHPEHWKLDRRRRSTLCYITDKTIVAPLVYTWILEIINIFDLINNVHYNFNVYYYSII